MKNKPYFLALNRISKIGPRTITKLLQRWPDLEELFQLPVSQMEAAGLTTSMAQSIAAFDMSRIDKDWRWHDKPGHALLTWDDPDYPKLLREIHDPPPVLYAIGDLSVFTQPTVALIGTRKPSIIGSETAYQFAFDLAQNGITIVSGLALGIDAQSHSGCLQAKGKTIAVMGTGIDCIYPYRHKRLAANIGQEGLLLSEFPLGTSPVAGHFPRRNRIISGLSLATLVVEAAVRSGSLITARLALEQNREVMAIPGSIHSPQSKGCHALLQQGATLVTSSMDVLNELQLDCWKITRVETPSALATVNKNLVKCVGFEVTTVDQVMERSGFSVEKVICDLAELEVQGIVKAVPGGYMRCMV